VCLIFLYASASQPGSVASTCNSFPALIDHAIHLHHSNLSWVAHTEHIG
jgi:hypothetical protein